jgi:hypothetical protein
MSMSFRSLLSPSSVVQAAVLLGALHLSAAPLAAKFSVGVRASTLGIAVDAGYRLNSRLALRAGINKFSFTRDEEIEGIEYMLKPDLSSFSGLVDFYPFGGVLHLTGGLIANNNSASAVALNTGTIEIGDESYTPSEVQELRGDLEWSKSTAPYLGFGLNSGGRVGLVFEAGVAFSGTPTVRLSGTTSFTGPQKAVFDQAVADEEAEIRTWIDDNERFTKYYPVVALGLRIRF